MKQLINFITLFSSLGTLICCALPVLLVSLGLGSTLVSVISVFPELLWISEHKVMVFVFAGLMLIFSLISFFTAQGKSCPIDPSLAKSCALSKVFTRYILGLSVGIYLIGLFFAFILPSFSG